MRQLLLLLCCLPILASCGVHAPFEEAATTAPDSARPTETRTSVTTQTVTTEVAPDPTTSPQADYAWPAYPEEDGVASCPSTVLESYIADLDPVDHDGGRYTIAVTNTSKDTWCGVKDFPKLTALSTGNPVGRIAHINGMVPETVELAPGKSAYVQFELRGGAPCSGDSVVVDSIGIQWPLETTMQLPSPVTICTDTHQVPPLFITGPLQDVPTF